MGEEHIINDSIPNDVSSQVSEIPEPKSDVKFKQHGISYIRSFVIGYIILQIAILHAPELYYLPYTPISLQLILNDIIDQTMIYLLYIVPLGIIVYLVCRILLLILNKGQISSAKVLILDFVLTSSLIITLVLNLGFLLGWTGAFLASPIFDIQIISLIQNVIVIGTMFFLVLGLFYRFLSRLNQSLYNNKLLGLVYLRDSGRMVGRAIGPLLGFSVAILTPTISQLWILVIPMIVLFVTQYERLQSDSDLSKLSPNMFPTGKIREKMPVITQSQPQEKIIYEQFRFSIKKLSRWLIGSIVLVMILYFTNTTDILVILFLFVVPPSGIYYSNVNPYIYWTIALEVSIFAIMLFIFTYHFYRFRNKSETQGKTLSPRHRLEWLADFGISIIAFVLFILYMIPQIGFAVWSDMSQNLFYNTFYQFTPGYTPWAGLVLATIFQITIVVILIGIILRLIGDALGFLERNELSALRWQLNSGKILITGMSLAIGYQILLSGGLYFGLVPPTLIISCLILIIVTMLFSFARIHDIRLSKVGGEGQ